MRTHAKRLLKRGITLATAQIERWSKAALVKWKAEKERGIIKHDERVRTLAEYHVRGASFNPTELRLAPGMPEADWMDVGRAVAHVYESAHFWLGDWIEYGRKTYGIVTAYHLAKQATGLSEGTLRCAARCARSYKPEERHPSLSYMHHMQIVKYPPETREKLLTEAEEIGLTTRQVRKAAEELHGTNEREDVLKRHLVSVYLWPETYERFRDLAHSDNKRTNWFITRALEEWLRIKGHADALKPELTTEERRARWEADGICIMCGTNEAWAIEKYASLAVIKPTSTSGRAARLQSGVTRLRQMVCASHAAMPRRKKAANHVSRAWKIMASGQATPHRVQARIR